MLQTAMRFDKFVFCYFFVCACSAVAPFRQADMREMQNMYRSQYDELLTRAAVGEESGASPA